MSANVVLRVHNSTEIEQREGDRYIDATAMCRAYGKRLDHYLSNEGTKAFLEATALRLGVPIQIPGNPGICLIEARRGQGGGTYVHPRVAIHLAQWLSPEFAALVAEWMEELLTKGSVGLDHAPQPAPLDVRQLVHDVVASMTSATPLPLVQRPAGYVVLADFVRDAWPGATPRIISRVVRRTDLVHRRLYGRPCPKEGERESAPLAVEYDCIRAAIEAITVEWRREYETEPDLFPGHANA